jgi:hypothetical protein
MSTPALELQENDTQETENRRGKNSLGRLKDRLKSIDKLMQDPKVNGVKQSALCIAAADIEKMLFQTEREDKADKTRAELATVTEQLTTANAEIARLNALNAELKDLSRSNQRVTPERIPDSVLQQEITVKDEMLKSVATLARDMDIDERARHAVRLTMQHSKRAMETVNNLGVDFSSVVVNLQRSKTDLLNLLQQAQREGSSTPLLRAVLFVRDGVTATIGKQQPRFVNEFSNEYDRL